jgi:hypothetical protein
MSVDDAGPQARVVGLFSKWMSAVALFDFQEPSKGTPDTFRICLEI